MLSASEYRKLAGQYRTRALVTGLAPNEATLLRNIARTLSALASQLEILAEYDAPKTKKTGLRRNDGANY
jgi:hypothetical protein